MELTKTGNILKAWRRSIRRLTQEKAAVMLGVSITTIQRIEQGNQHMNLQFAKKIAALYGRDYRQLEAEDAADIPPDPRLFNSFYLVVHPLAPVTTAEKERMERQVYEANLAIANKAAK